MSSATVNPNLKNRCLRILREVSSTHGILPKSYFPPGVTLQSGTPHATGGFADVWEGQLDGNWVRVKAFRIQTVTNPQKIKHVCSNPIFKRGNELFKPDPNQRFYREIVGWKHISHSNVLPFLGVSEMLSSFCVLTPWLLNGNIVEYTKKYHKANRLQLVSVHQNRQSNYLISLWVARTSRLWP